MRGGCASIHMFPGHGIPPGHGIFAFGRDPIYSGFSLAFLGFAIKLDAPVNFAVAAGFVLAADLWYMRRGEWRE